MGIKNALGYVASLWDPADLPKSVTDRMIAARTLRYSGNGNCCHVVGVHHLSHRSQREVSEVAARVRPKYVMVELCQERLNPQVAFAIYEGHTPQQQTLPELTWANLRHIYPTLLTPEFWLLALPKVELECISQLSEGGEQLLAIAEAMHQQPDGNVEVQTVDSPYSTTVAKVVTALWFDVGPVGLFRDVYQMDMISKAYPLIHEVQGKYTALDDMVKAAVADESFLTDDSLHEMQELAQELSSMQWDWTSFLEGFQDTNTMRGIAQPLLYDRDTILAHRIHAATRRNQECMAVVGAAHVAGIAAKWGKTTEQDVQDALAFPSERIWTMLAQYCGLMLVTPTIAIAASYKFKKKGGDAYRYFRYARRTWVAASCAGTLYFADRLRRRYNLTRDFQLTMERFRTARDEKAAA